MLTKLVSAFRQRPPPAPSPAASGLPVAAAPAPPPPVLAEVPSQGLHLLSPREREILMLIARGDSNKAIGRTLDIAETTVKIHVQHILRKLGLTSRVQAAVLAANSRIG